jgi:hypothetical protein
MDKGPWTKDHGPHGAAFLWSMVSLDYDYENDHEYEDDKGLRTNRAAITCILVPHVVLHARRFLSQTVR